MLDFRPQEGKTLFIIALKRAQVRLCFSDIAFINNTAFMSEQAAVKMNLFPLLPECQQSILGRHKLFLAAQERGCNN